MFLELVLYVYQGLSPFFPVDVAPQVAQARNMNIGIVAKHLKLKDLYGEKTYSF